MIYCASSTELSGSVVYVNCLVDIDDDSGAINVQDVINAVKMLTTIIRRSIGGG